MREIRPSGSEGGAAQINAPSLPLSQNAHPLRQGRFSKASAQRPGHGNAHARDHFHPMVADAGGMQETVLMALTNAEGRTGLARAKASSGTCVLNCCIVVRSLIEMYDTFDLQP